MGARESQLIWVVKTLYVSQPVIDCESSLRAVVDLVPNKPCNLNRNLTIFPRSAKLATTKQHQQSQHSRSDALESKQYTADDQHLHDSTVPAALRELISGSFAGMAGKLVEHPLDLVKTRLQTQSMLVRAGNPTSKQTPLFNGPLDCFVKTIRKEGPLGLYQGLASPMFGATLEIAALFFGYNQLKRHLLRPDAPDHVQFDRLMLCGAGAGTLAAILLNPFEVIKVQAQVYRLRNPTGASTYQVFRQALRADGWRCLYRGFAGTLVREMGGGAIWFGTYEYACMTFMSLNGGDSSSISSSISSSSSSSSSENSKRELSAVQLVSAGAAAGVAYNFSFFPADVLKSIYQSRRPGDERLPLTRLVRDIYRRQGVRGFYQGLGVTLVRAVPGNAAIFLTYEFVSRALH
jgi:ornithine carrier protein